MKLKVFGGLVFLGGKQVRGVMASTARSKVAAATGINLGYIRDYWSITGNEKEVAAAMAAPETPLVSLERWEYNFVPLASVKK